LADGPARDIGTAVDVAALRGGSEHLGVT